MELRWWQRLALRRQYEVDAAGALVWGEGVESTPRRAGKSTKHKVESLWRVVHADRFGERQLVMLTGKDLPVCKEIHRQGWPFAQGLGWTVRRTNGQEEVEAPDGSRWMVRSQDGVYGYDTTAGRVDEAWAVPGYVVDDGLEPSMLERVQPQLWLTSTAHRKATSLMPTRIEDAMGAGGERRPLLLLWGAGPGDRPDDERVWRAAAPHWSEQRLVMMRRAWARATSGESLDPDEANPVESFRAQYLNVWPGKAAEERERATFPDGLFEVTSRPAGPPRVAAVEAWFEHGAVAVLAWPGPVVEVKAWPTAAQAVAWARDAGAEAFHVGKSLTGMPELAGVSVAGEGATTGWAVAELHRLATQPSEQSRLQVVGPGSDLFDQTGQVRSVRVPTGLTFRTRGRADAIKATVWAARAVLTAPEPSMVF